jgi:hypothetical protein
MAGERPSVLNFTETGVTLEETEGVGDLEFV